MKKADHSQSVKHPWSGEHYKKHGGFQKHDWVLRAIGELDGNEAILDIGCGDGSLTVKMAEKVPDGGVIGIDFSPSMIKTARSLHGHVPNVSFEVGDATSFTFDQTFDVITSFFVFHWVKDLLAAFKNIKKHVKPGGRVVASMAAVQHDSPIHKAFDHLEREGTWKAAIERSKKSYCPRSAEEVMALLEQAGFQDVDVTVIRREAGSPSLEASAQSLMRSIPHSTGLSHDEALRFAHDIASNMYKQFGKKPDEPIEFVSSFLCIKVQG